MYKQHQKSAWLTPLPLDADEGDDKKLSPCRGSFCELVCLWVFGGLFVRYDFEALFRGCRRICKRLTYMHFLFRLRTFRSCRTGAPSAAGVTTLLVTLLVRVATAVRVVPSSTFGGWSFVARHRSRVCRGACEPLRGKALAFEIPQQPIGLTRGQRAPGFACPPGGLQDRAEGGLLLRHRAFTLMV